MPSRKQRKYSDEPDGGEPERRRRGGARRREFSGPERYGEHDFDRDRTGRGDWMPNQDVAHDRDRDR